VTSYACTRYGDKRLVFPLHGADRGGPIVCPKCAGEIEQIYSYERNVWLARLGMKERPRPRGPTYLTLELSSRSGQSQVKRGNRFLSRVSSGVGFA
jgi:hypothetical protein